MNTQQHYINLGDPLILESFWLLSLSFLQSMFILSFVLIQLFPINSRQDGSR